jgi:drug/metabolite transporter (DMT)-like permease
MQRLWMVLGAGLIFGSSTVMTRMALVGNIPPLTVTAIQQGLGVLAFAIVLLVMRRPPPAAKIVWRDLAILGLLYTTLPSILFTTGLQGISSGLFTVITALVPLLTSVMAHFLLADEKLTWIKLGGLGLGLAGVLVIVLTGTSGLQAGGNPLISVLLVFAGAAIASLSLIWIRRRLAWMDSLTMAGWQIMPGWLMIAAVTVLTGNLSFEQLSGQAWLALVYAGVVGSCGGFMLSMLLASKFGAMASTLPSYVMPVVAGLLGVLLLGEVITFTMLIGAALVLAGVVITSRFT